MLAICRFLFIFAGLIMAAPASAEVLTVATVSTNVNKSIKTFEPLASYLERELLSDGITKVRISVLSSSEAISDAMRNGSIDLYIGSPIVAAQVARDGGGRPILIRWKEQAATDHSVLIARSDSGLETLEDLRNSRLGFENRESTFGYLLATDLLHSAGLALEELPSRLSTPSQGNVGYIFTGGDHNTLAWIYKGWIDAAATSPASYQRLTMAAPEDFRIIARSMDIPREAVVIRAGIARRIATSIEHRLVSMAETDQGRQVLAAFGKTSKFERIPDETEGSFAPVYDLLDRLDDLGAG